MYFVSVYTKDITLELLIATGFTDKNPTTEFLHSLG